MRHTTAALRAMVQAAALVIAGGLWLARPAGAQIITGSATAGLQEFGHEPRADSLAKLLMYRAVPKGAVFNELFLRLSTADSVKTVQLFGTHLGEQDQRLSLRLNDPGRADLQVRWDRAPHVYSTNARFLGTETSPGVYALRTPRPDSNAVNGSPFVAPIKQQWDPVRVGFTLTPTPTWDFKADYIRIDKSGQRPMGMAFGGPSNNTREIPEPIDQTMHDLRFSEAYTRDHYQLMVSYGLSVFDNAITSVTSDNPQATTDTKAGFSSRGRSALSPSNRAQNLTATGSVALPLRTQVTGTAGWGWWTQNQDFIAATINSADADSLARAGYVFPKSLNGSIHTSLVNFTLNSHPISRVSLTGRYRSYSYKDLTEQITMPILVINDRNFSGATETDILPWSRNNADGGASLRLLRYLTLSGSYAWERMNRDTSVRNVLHVTEKTPKVSLDFTGLAWATLRAGYSHATRRGDGYHQVDASEMPEARRFDEADRNRDRLSLMAGVTPIDQLTLSGTWEFGRDTFPNSAYGVQRDNNNAIGFEVAYNPVPRVMLSGGYLHEWYDNQFHGRYRTGSTNATLNNATWQWIATNLDTTTTWFVNASAVVIPGRLEAGGSYELSKSSFRMMAYNPQTPTGGTSSQNAAATATDFPLAHQQLKPITLYARYLLNADWSVIARFQSEKFDQFDFRTTGLKPSTGNHVFLGNDLLPYDATWFSIAVSFRPGLMKLMRSAM